VYEAALSYELIQQGLQVKTQVGVPVDYKGVQLEIGFRMDLLVEDQVIVEIKSVEKLMDVHKKQLLTYLKLADKKVGLLVNFNAVSLNDKENLIRIIN
jgi:GxxExxY protein